MTRTRTRIVGSLLLSGSVLLSTLSFSGCKCYCKTWDECVPSEAVMGLTEAAWADWRKTAGVQEALDKARAMDETLRVTIVNWDNQVRGLKIGPFDTFMRTAVTREQGCDYVDRGHLQVQLTELKSLGIQVDPAEPKQIFLERVRKEYNRLLGDAGSGDNIRFAARGTITHVQNTLMLELTVLDVKTGDAGSGFATYVIPNLAPELY